MKNKPIQKYTAKWVFFYFQGFCFLTIGMKQQVVTNTATQTNNTTTNTAPVLKQFPELIFGDKTK